MADQKISQLPTITGANMSDDDKFVLVDTSGDATVATTRAEFFKSVPDVTFGTNNKALFGAGSDLQIYHNGSNSYIDDAGTGNLQIRASSQVKLQKYTGENMFVGIADGAASMYYDNAQKIATTSTGIDVTGTVIAESLGIGEDDPDSVLHIKKTDATAYSPAATDGQVGVGPTIYLENPANANDTVGGQIVFGMRSTEEQARIGATGGTAPALVFGTGDAERMQITSGGIVGVGDGLSVPSAYGGQIVSYQNNGSALSTFASVNSVTTGTARQIDFFRGASTARIGSIESTPTSVSFNTSSDYRLKTDAQPMTGASERVQELNPVNFEWISDGTRVDGFLAHEAQEVVPGSVTGERDAMRDEEYEVTPEVLDDDGNVTTEAVMGTRSVPDYQGIDQSKLVPLLTAALQEALTEISSLKSRVEALEG